MPMEPYELALKCRELADNKKAESIVIMDLRGLSSVTDFFLIATGTSAPHLRAITEEIILTLKRVESLRPTSVDGGGDQSWIVLDYFDVIVHVMRPETRAHYDLEGLWSDAPRVKPEKPKHPAEAPLDRLTLRKRATPRSRKAKG